MKKSTVLGVIGAAALAASLVGNIYFYRRLAGAGTEPETPPDPVTEKTPAPAAAAPAPAVPVQSGKTRLLGPAPILLNRAEWRDGAIVMHFDTEAPLLSASAKVSPKLAVKGAVGNTRVSFKGDFRPGESYRVTVLKGAKNAAGGVLENDAAAVVKIPDMEPKVAFATSGTYLPLAGKKLVIPFGTVNLDKVEVSVCKAFENNLNPYHPRSWESDARMVEVARKTIPIKAPKNREVFHELDLENLLGGRKAGVYRIFLECRSPEGGDNAEQYVSITDMALQVASDANSGKVAVFARSLATGKPVAGAELTVLSYKNQIAAKGRTDENGGAILVCDPAWDREHDYMQAVLARKDGDLAYFRLNSASENFSDHSDRIVPGAPRAFVFTERGIARPGEEFAAAAFLRREDKGDYAVMPDTPLEFTLRSPTGDKMLTRTLRSDAHGFATTAITLPETAATGFYTVECSAAGAKETCGTATIQIANYVPDRIKAAGRSLTADTAVDVPLEFEFDAKYYFGAPLEEGAFNYKIASARAPFPAHWEKSWRVGDAKSFTAAAAFTGRGTKGTDGVKLRYPGFAAQKGKSFDPVQIVAAFEIAEPGGRGVTARVWKNLYPTPFFIGLREGESKGREKRIEYTLLPAEKADTVDVPAGFAVTFELVRKEWEYALVRTENHRRKREWVQREIPLPEFTRTVAIPAGAYRVGTIDPASWELPSGEYTLVARSGDAWKTRLDFSWYFGESGRSANANTIYFRTDAEEVAPGGQLTVSFDAAGDGEAFLVSGERSLDTMRMLPVKSGENHVTLTVPQNLHSSSFFVGCTMVVKRNGILNRSFGLLKIKVDQSKNHRLDVALRHADTAAPGEEIPVTVTLKDASGNPQKGAVCLYAVDAGVVSLTDYTAPDIFGHFYGEIGCPMSFFDMYGLLYEDLGITADGRIGGDGAARKLGKIKQKRTARLVVPLVEVPASGTATVKAKLPRHTGAMEFFAVASSDRKAGSTQSRIVMRKPVTVTVSAPRYLAPGDTAELALTLFNHDAAEADYSCTVALPAGLEALDNAKTFAGKALKPGEQRRHTLKVRATERLGAGKVSAVLTVGAAKADDDTFVTVRSVNVAQTAYRFAVLKANESFTASFAGEFIGEPAGALRLAASPALAVKNALDWLNDYPHGCLEQTTAGAFPYLALPALAKVGLIDAALAATNRHKVGAAYAQLQTMALADGSFAMWPGGNTTWNEATLFALHFVFAAEKRGLLSLDATARQKHLSWLRNQLANADPAKRAFRAYTAYVLATAGDRSFVTAARHIAESASQPDFALFLAGGALVKGGYAKLGAPLMLDALKSECWREPGAPTSFSDEGCRLGMTLHILMECSLPGDELPARLAFELAKCIRKDGSAWGTTQANAWAALGLAAYAEKFPPLAAKAEVSVGGKSDKLEFSGAKDLPARDGAVVVNRADAPLIVESRITGIPRKTPPDGGTLVLKKEFLNEKGEVVREARHGDKIYVRLTLKSPAEFDDLVISDLLPGGLEIEDETLASRAVNLTPAMAAKYGELVPTRLEKRDDRVIVFGDTGRGTGVVTYQTRAVIRGEFAIPPLQAEAMYRPDVSGICNGGGVFTVK